MSGLRASSASLPPELQARLTSDVGFLREVVQRLLSEHFPPSLSTTSSSPWACRECWTRPVQPPPLRAKRPPVTRTFDAR